MPEQSWYRTKQFAALAGVTARTLHHYDRVGLLKPARRSHAGYRLYHADDLERLEQIVALKFLGLSLADIRRVLQHCAAPLLDELDRQRSVLIEKRQLLDRAIAAIGDVRDAANQGEPTAELLRRVIGVITMQNDSNWMLKYYSPEAQAKIAQRAKSFTPEMQAAVSEAWKSYYRERAALQVSEDPGGGKATALEQRRQELVTAFTGDDPDVEAGLRALYRDRANWPDEMKNRMADLEPPPSPY